MLCLYVPDFAIAAHRRREPALAERALAIAPAGGKILHVSEEALRAGVTPGMTAVQARAACPDLVCVDPDETLYRSAFDAFMTRLLTLAPRVEAGPLGMAYLDTRGLGRLYGKMEILVERAVAAARDEGIAARAGVARSKLVARLAAAHGDGRSIIYPSSEKKFLGALPISALEPPKALREQLFLLGIHTVGQFAVLDAAAVVARYGLEGARLRRMAVGEDDQPFRPWRPVPEWAEEVPIDFPLVEAERLSFLLAMPLERLLERLAADGLACQELAVSLELEAAEPKRDLRRLGLAVAPGMAPATVARTFLDLLRLDLERTPTAGPVTRVNLEVAAAAAPFGEQGRLFDRNPGRASAVAQAIAKLQARLGEDAVFSPELVDTWRPERAYRPGDPKLVAAPSKRPGQAKDEASPPPAGLRVLQEPAPIRVRELSGRPVHLVWKELSTPVVSSSGPWSLSGEWWAAVFDRDYHEIETSAGRRLWIFRDCRTGAWFVQGEEG